MPDWALLNTVLTKSEIKQTYNQSFISINNSAGQQMFETQDKTGKGKRKCPMTSHKSHLNISLAAQLSHSCFGTTEFHLVLSIFHIKFAWFIHLNTYYDVNVSFEATWRCISTYCTKLWTEPNCLVKRSILLTAATNRYTWCALMY